MTKWRMAVQAQRYRAKNRGLTEHFTLNQLLDLIERNGCKCAQCNKGMDECTLSVDHIIPLSRGGSNTIDNIQILCTVCNSQKSDKATGLQRVCNTSGFHLANMKFTEEDWEVLNTLCAMYGNMDKTSVVRRALRHMLKTKPKFVLAPTEAKETEE